MTPADKKLLALSFEPALNPVISPFRAMGEKYNALATLDREWVAVNLTGKPTYSEMIYPLASILSSGVVDSGGGAYTWTFDTNPSAPDTVQTYTVEYGNDTTGAHRFAGAVVRSMGLGFSRRNGITQRGEMIGSVMEEGITLTATPTAIPLVPILPTQTSVYLNEASGDIGTTKLSRVWDVNWNLNNKFNPVWPLDSAVSGYAATVELAPEHTLELVMSYDTEGQAMLTRLRAGTMCFIRVEAIGATIGGGNTYRARLDFAGMVSAVARPTDVDGVMSIGWTFIGIKDSVWGKVVEIELVNAQSAL